MIFFWIAAFCGVLSLLGIAFDHKGDAGFAWCASWWVVAFLFFFFGSAIPSGVAWSNQIGDQESLKQVHQVRFVYQQKAMRLTAQFKEYLAVAYPAHEKHIFDAISPGNVAFYFARYPEIQASKTAIELVQQVRDLNDSVYEQDVKAARIKRDIRARSRSPWLVQWVIPK